MCKKIIAHIVFEAKTPLKVSSNRFDFFKDSVIQRDWNDLPMILGTSLCGILRKDYAYDNEDEIFGKENASKIIFSNALFLDENEKVNEDLILEKSEFLKLASRLTQRDHNSISSKGVTKNAAKFDEEIIYKGSRFKFSMEMPVNSEQDEKDFNHILDLLSKNTFRVGGGSTKGYGEIKVISIKYDIFESSSQKYIDFSSSLNENLSQEYPIKENIDDSFDHYRLLLSPEDYFIFGSSCADNEADDVNLKEQAIDYANQCLSRPLCVIPASSIKGALSHRTCFHYNKLKGNFIGSNTVVDNVESIFGSKKEQANSSKAKILIHDIFLQEAKEKVFNHVGIDRFTSGAINGALFQEKAISCNEYCLDIYLKKDIQDKEAIEAFELALCDLAKANLALGGKSTKGHGYFYGKVIKNGESIC
ncbi:hypothetical protein ACEQH8_000464 [Campylobacter lari]|nr:RAMP superfamily CRISPR-associated protein [Campylobacter lari]MCV3440364.1 RAMP superfamily CRISPR-associated protein [Campylobacter lari]